MTSYPDSNPSFDSAQPVKPRLRPWRTIFFHKGKMGVNWMNSSTIDLRWRWRDVTPSSKARVRRLLAAMSKNPDTPMWEYFPGFMLSDRVKFRDPFTTDISTGTIVDVNGRSDVGRRFDFIVRTNEGQHYGFDAHELALADEVAKREVQKDSDPDITVKLSYLALLMEVADRYLELMGIESIYDVRLR